MLRGFTVLNPSGDTYTFTLERPEEMGVLINDITGLGPPKSNLILQNVYNQDGSRYNAARLETRQIAFELQMIGDGIPGSRRMLYAAFPIQQPVVLTFHTDVRDYEARGYVESVTPNIFSQNESVQVVILCPQPYLTLPGNWEAGIPFETKAGGFQFPFYNNAGQASLEFNTTERVSSRSIEYMGEVPSGFMIRMPMLGNPGLVSLYNHTRGELLQINVDLYRLNTGTTPGSGHTLEIDSRPETFGAVIRQPDGSVYQATGLVTINSKWPKLQPGENALEVYTSLSRTVNVFSSVTVYYSTYFMGV
jgi:hypothetical protein